MCPVDGRSNLTHILNLQVDTNVGVEVLKILCRQPVQHRVWLERVDVAIFGVCRVDIVGQDVDGLGCGGETGEDKSELA